ncbi:MAG TPA: DUF2339 domain-containing protein [Rhodocyclaceae bacterium]|nr:DUF2339 domain-containing protein [Rhodocyclaceae bacterium]
MLSALVILLLLIWLAILGKRSGKPAADQERLKTLEEQVQWLYRETQRLRAELAALKGEAPAEGAVPPPAPEAPAGTVDTTAAPAAEPAPAPAALTWWQRLLAGNLLAKVGVVLLFFGVASALRLAADYGYLPVSLRLLVGAVGGVAMIAFGWAKARQGGHEAFGIAVQGGGFAILYLIVYFMLARYALLGPTPAFLFFALIGVGCVLLAAAQDGEILAVLGLAGAFFAPVLADRIGDDPLPLFGYFTLLNAFIVGVSWFKAWRVLDVAGFVLTIGVGMAWAVDHYRAEHYPATQGFLVFFWLLYSATPVLMAWFRAPGRAGWNDAVLVFGTPLVGFALQSRLAADRYELAWAAFAAALYYGALWLFLFLRGPAELRLLERCQLGLAIAFGTLAVPLGFGVHVTTAFWALEGVAVLWFGAVQGRRPAVLAGAGLQLAAGAWLLWHLPGTATGLPVVNEAFFGMALVAGTGYASARLLTDERAVAALWWALGWWMAAGLREIHFHASDANGAVLGLVFLAGTLAVTLWLHRARAWQPAGQAALLPGAVLALWLAWTNLTEPGALGGLPYLPVLNAFDFAQLLALAALTAWQRRVVALGAFVWISCLAARIAHHWGGVPFTGPALWHSTLAQTLLTLLWTLLAIAAMIRAARIGARLLWQAGFGLLALVGAKLLLVDLHNAGTLLWTGSLIGVALLVLAAGYFAPVPPRQSE